MKHHKKNIAPLLSWIASFLAMTLAEKDSPLILQALPHSPVILGRSVTTTRGSRKRKPYSFPTLNTITLSLSVHALPSASVIARNEVPKQSRTNNASLLCLCLQQSGWWILDVARPVGRALKDDGKGGKPVFKGKPRKVDCRVGRAMRTLSSQ
jgi:hypothetical protein